MTSIFQLTNWLFISIQHNKVMNNMVIFWYLFCAPIFSYYIQCKRCYITETEMSFWWNIHHWLHRKLSKWQLSVQPVMKISSKWLHFRFSDSQSTMLIVIWSNQLQSVTVTCSPPRYAAWVLMFTLSVTTFTMDNALLVPDKFHNIQSKYGAVYQVNYHMKCLSLRPGPRLNIKTVLSTYGDFYVKDKTAVRTSYL